MLKLIKNAVINHKILNSDDVDEKGKSLIKLLNKYGVWGEDAANLVHEIVMIFHGDAND